MIPVLQTFRTCLAALLVLMAATASLQAQGYSFIFGTGLETSVRTGMRLPNGELLALSNDRQPGNERGYSLVRVKLDGSMGFHPAQGVENFFESVGLTVLDTNYVYVLEHYASDNQQLPGLRLAIFERTHLDATFVLAPAYAVLIPTDSTLVRGGDLCAAHDQELIAAYAVTAGPGASDYDAVLSKRNLDGFASWTRTFPHPDLNFVVDVEPFGAGYALLVADSNAVTGQWNGRLILTDAAGLAVHTETLGTGYQPAQLRPLSNGEVAIIGTHWLAGNTSALFVARYDAAGTLSWRRDDLNPNTATRGYALNERFDGELLALGNEYVPAFNTWKMLTTRLSGDGTTVTSQQRFPITSQLNRTYTPRYLVPDDAGGFVAVADRADPALPTNPIGLILRADAAGIVQGALVRGIVRRDTDGNCQPDPADPGLGGWTVEAASATRVFFTTVQPDGTYEMAVDSGQYTVRIVPPSDVWDPCIDSFSVYAAYLDTAEVNFAVEALVDCPVLDVDLGTAWLRQCSPATYAVAYRNLGSAVATDAYVEVTIDSLLTVTGSSLPWTTVQGHTYTFPLGDVPAGTAGYFLVDVEVPCDVSLLGITHCSDAHIYPDTACLPTNPLWSGARVEVEAECRDSVVAFRLRNTGTAPMSQPLDYVIIEDAVLMMQGTFQLADGAFQDITAPKNGATYHFAAGQEAYAPGGGRPLVSLEGCAGDSVASLGYVVQFPQNEDDLFIAVSCSENVGAYDPNDKIGYPTGTGAAHTVAAGEAIDYVIRFQNTGTDTAFRVVILDELSPDLDPATLRAGASSHPYTVELLANGLVRFEFDPIVLPDSAANAAGSQGFVQFRVGQKPGLAPGTTITNTAGIFFDFNPAIVTNTTLHTIGVPYTLAVIDGPENGGAVPVRIAPNPFVDAARFELGIEPSMPATLRVFDAQGRTAASVAFAGRSAWLQRAGLPAGLYFFVIEAGGRRLATGRLFAQ